MCGVCVEGVCGVCVEGVCGVCVECVCHPVTCLIQGLIAMPILIFLKSASLMPSCLCVCVEGVCVGCVLRVCVCHLFDPGFDGHADPHLPEVGLAHAEQRAELFVCVCVC